MFLTWCKALLGADDGRADLDGVPFLILPAR